MNNFLWNELWTFRGLTGPAGDWAGWWRRLAKFYLICVAGIGWSVLLLNVEVRGLEMNLYWDKK